MCLSACGVLSAAVGTPSALSAAVAWLAFVLAVVSAVHMVVLTAQSASSVTPEATTGPAVRAGVSTDSVSGASAPLPPSWTASAVPGGLMYCRPDGRRFLVTETAAKGPSGVPVIIHTRGPFRSPYREGPSWRLQGQPADLFGLMEAL